MRNIQLSLAFLKTALCGFLLAIPSNTKSLDQTYWLGGFALVTTASTLFLFYKLHTKRLVFERKEKDYQDLLKQKEKKLHDLKKQLEAHYQPFLNVIQCATVVAYPGRYDKQYSLVLRTLKLATLMAQREGNQEDASHYTLLQECFSQDKKQSLLILQGIDNARNDLGI